jgi:opacity protein-like surface antigen
LEHLDYLDVPLSLKYYILNSPLTPYGQIGADFSWLLKALSTTSRDAESDLVDRTDLRTSYMTGLFGAAGVSYAFKGFCVFADFRYIYFHDLVNKEGTRYADEVNLYKYYYIDDDFRMNNLQVNVGASYVLNYSLKKVK